MAHLKVVLQLVQGQSGYFSFDKQRHEVGGRLLLLLSNGCCRRGATVAWRLVVGYGWNRRLRNRGRSSRRGRSPEKRPTQQNCDCGYNEKYRSHACNIWTRLERIRYEAIGGSSACEIQKWTRPEAKERRPVL